MPDGHDIVLRPASPDVDEGLAFAHYLDIAADGFFRVLLGKHSKEILAQAFTLPGHDLSHEYVTVAEVASEIVGMASAYSWKQHARSSDEPFTRHDRYPRARVAVLGTLFSPVLRFINTLDDGDYYLQAIAVNPDCRGTGVGSRLIGHVEDLARASGARHLCLDVSTRNPGARRLYERMGMAVRPGTPRFLGIPVSMIVRMSKQLG